jgi:rare lipoprotein A (peptidoglycan hydrolase)
MEAGRPRPARGKTERRHTRFDRLGDRVALWAALVALLGLITAAGTAHAMGGGVGGPGTTSTSAYAANAKFGSRPLRKGDKGSDVKTLNWILKSLPFASGVPGSGTFGVPTAKTVRTLQRNAGLAVNGIVASSTRKALKQRMSSAVATWYGPGLYGNVLGCGGTLDTGTVGVANKVLPCGTKVTFAYNKRYVTTKVIDRGPFVDGRCWDLTEALKNKLGFPQGGSIKYAVAGGAAAC